MSKTERHRDFWKMRQLGKRMRGLYRIPMPAKEAGAVRRSPLYRALDQEFERLWSKYGYKSMVNDKRRRVSSRKSNSEFVRRLRRAERHRQAQRWREDAAHSGQD